MNKFTSYAYVAKHNFKPIKLSPAAESKLAWYKMLCQIHKLVEAQERGGRYILLLRTRVWTEFTLLTSRFNWNL